MAHNSPCPAGFWIISWIPTPPAAMESAWRAVRPTDKRRAVDNKPFRTSWRPLTPGGVNCQLAGAAQICHLSVTREQLALWPGEGRCLRPHSLPASLSGRPEKIKEPAALDEVGDGCSFSGRRGAGQCSPITTNGSASGGKCLLPPLSPPSPCWRRREGGVREASVDGQGEKRVLEEAGEG